MECLKSIIARDPDHNMITGCLFLLLTLGMIASVVPLILAIRALRQKAVVLAN